MSLILDCPIEIVRTSRRKTASIKILNGQVQVVIPEYLSEERLEQLILKRTSWIRQKLKIQSLHSTPKSKEYVSGECFTYLGKNYRLKLMQSEMDEVRLRRGNLEVGTSLYLSGPDRQALIRQKLVHWYQSHALERLEEKTDRYSKILGVTPKSVSVRNYRSRWGSCSIKGGVSYNWRIIIAPHHIVDYVVVHELCHMLEHNHSAAFWRCIENILPQCHESRDWLKLNGCRLFV